MTTFDTFCAIITPEVRSTAVAKCDQPADETFTAAASIFPSALSTFAMFWLFISGVSLSAAPIKRDHPVPEETTSAAASTFPSALSVFAISWAFISGARRDAASERRLHPSGDMAAAAAGSFVSPL